MINTLWIDFALPSDSPRASVANYLEFLPRIHQSDFEALAKITNFELVGRTNFA
jgi:hypothetical protein